LIDSDEGTFIFEKGQEFNQIIQESAKFHGWDFVSGIEKAFNGFGYCNNPTFYVGREESKSKQGNDNGTIHPNLKGQRVIRDRILETIQTYSPRVFHDKQITVRFEKIQGSSLVSQGKDVTLFLGANGKKVIAGGSRINGNQKSSGGSVTFFIDDGLSGPLVVPSGELVIEGPEDGDFTRKYIEFSQQFGLADNFGEGVHISKFPGLEIHYRIEVENEDGEWLTFVLSTMMN
jgi:hypothetical protein